ncbi:MAG: hypothetical protein C5B52_01595 [Bacteroidetes bacterium]|nr:MAG: hypothetical protein C5B52_01595 [Bacteroidota bacterium]
MLLWLLLILLVLAFGLSFLLFAPFYIEFDSRKGLCQIRLQKVVSARICVIGNSLYAEIKMGLWHKKIDLFENQNKSENKKSKSRDTTLKIPMKKIWKIVRSFKVDKCELNIDTGYIPLNGILYPLFAWLERRTGKKIQINFRDENEIIFLTRNNIARILWSYLKS